MHIIVHPMASTAFQERHWGTPQWHRCTAENHLKKEYASLLQFNSGTLALALYLIIYTLSISLLHFCS